MANLLFKADFSGNTAMGAASVSGNSGKWPISGGDNGFMWPILINGGSASGQTEFQPIANSTLTWNPNTSPPEIDANGARMFVAEIITGVRHDGTTGPILHQARYQPMDGVVQLPYVINPGSSPSAQYQSIYMKLPTNLATLMGPNGWYVVSEWKTDTSSCSTGENYCYRWILFVKSDSNGNLYWDMQGSNVSSSGSYFDDNNKTFGVPLGQWFQLEIAWQRACASTDFVWVKINGTQILNRQGGGSNPNGLCNGSAPINRIFIGQLYSNATASQTVPLEHWIDHVEIWDGVPSGSPPPPPPPPPPPGPSLTASSYNLAPGAAFTVSYANITAASGDWIGLYPVGQPFSYKVEYIHPIVGATSGTFNFTATGQRSDGGPGPGGANLAAGQYELRYYSNNPVTLVLTSSAITVAVLPPAPPPTPTGLAGTATVTVALSWTAVSGATSYDVFRNGTKLATVTNAAYTDTSASPGNSYSYAVDASNSGGTSAQSASITVVT